MMAPDVLDALWAKIEPIAYITKEQFTDGLKHWDIEVMRTGDGRIAFVTLTQDHEFHFESFGSSIPITPKMIKTRLDPIMEKYGCVTTTTPKDGMERQHRFNRAFGFRVVSEDEIFVHYRKDKPCR